MVDADHCDADHCDHGKRSNDGTGDQLVMAAITGDISRNAGHEVKASPRYYGLWG